MVAGQIIHKFKPFRWIYIYTQKTNETKKLCSPWFVISKSSDNPLKYDCGPVVDPVTRWLKTVIEAWFATLTLNYQGYQPILLIFPFIFPQNDGCTI